MAGHHAEHALGGNDRELVGNGGGALDRFLAGGAGALERFLRPGRDGNYLPLREGLLKAFRQTSPGASDSDGREFGPERAELEAAETREAALYLGEELGLAPVRVETPGGVFLEPHPDALAEARRLSPDERFLIVHVASRRARSAEPPALTPAQQARVEDAATAARSPRTTSVYRSQWRQFQSWAGLHALQELPAHPATVAAYLADRAEHGASVSTLRVASAAISAAHRDRGHSDPTKHEGVTRTMAGVSRQQAGRTKRQARALTTDAMAAIRATARQPRPWADGKRQETPQRAEQRGDLDIALCAVLRDALLRRSEAAALTWADIETDTDGSGRLTVKHSKTDQEGEGAVLYLSPQTMQDLDRIRPHPDNPGASVFGLGPARIGGRVQAAAQAAGLDGADLYTGHSGRVGMAQDLVKDGATLPELMQAGRWASPGMPAHYARAELAGQGAVARFYSRSNPDTPTNPAGGA